MLWIWLVVGLRGFGRMVWSADVVLISTQCLETQSSTPIVTVVSIHRPYIWRMKNTWTPMARIWTQSQQSPWRMRASIMSGYPYRSWWTSASSPLCRRQFRLFIRWWSCVLSVELRAFSVSKVALFAEVVLLNVPSVLFMCNLKRIPGFPSVDKGEGLAVRGHSGVVKQRCKTMVKKRMAKYTVRLSQGEQGPWW